MSNSPEKYQPSKEEMQKAERMMTPTQERLSDKRESREELQAKYESLKSEMGINGDVIKSGNTIQGEIDGHKIFLDSFGYGTIDNEQIGWAHKYDHEGTKIVMNLFRKLERLADLGVKVRTEKEQETFEEEKARGEVSDEGLIQERSEREERKRLQVTEESRKALEIAKGMLGEG